MPEVAAVTAGAEMTTLEALAQWLQGGLGSRLQLSGISAGHMPSSEKADLARKSSNAAEGCCGEFGAHFGGLCSFCLRNGTCMADTVRGAPLRTGFATHSHTGEPCRVCPLTNLGARRIFNLGLSFRLCCKPGTCQAGLHLFRSQDLQNPGSFLPMALNPGCCGAPMLDFGSLEPGFLQLSFLCL